jgi:hypothetical protein
MSKMSARQLRARESYTIAEGESSRSLRHVLSLEGHDEEKPLTLGEERSGYTFAALYNSDCNKIGVSNEARAADVRRCWSLLLLTRSALKGLWICLERTCGSCQQYQGLRSRRIALPLQDIKTC